MELKEILLLPRTRALVTNLPQSKKCEWSRIPGSERQVLNEHTPSIGF